MGRVWRCDLGLVGNDRTVEKRLARVDHFVINSGAHADRDSRASPPLWELRERAFLGLKLCLIIFGFFFVSKPFFFLTLKSFI